MFLYTDLGRSYVSRLLIHALAIIISFIYVISISLDPLGCMHIISVPKCFKHYNSLFNNLVIFFYLICMTNSLYVLFIVDIIFLIGIFLLILFYRSMLGNCCRVIFILFRVVFMRSLFFVLFFFCVLLSEISTVAIRLCFPLNLKF